MNSVFQAKEKLITSLQSGEGGAMGVVSETRLEEMRLEKEHVQAQLESTLQSLEGSRAEAQVCVCVCVCVRACVCVRGSPGGGLVMYVHCRLCVFFQYNYFSAP